MIGAAALSFAMTYIAVPLFNQYMHNIGIVGYDIMKKEKKPVADMGGPGVITSFLSGVFFFIGVELFITERLADLNNILAAISTVLIITLIGCFVIKWIKIGSVVLGWLAANNTGPSGKGVCQ